MNKLVLKILFFLLIFLPVNSEEKVKSIIDGNLDAKVNIIIFESLTCSHCANFHKDIFPKIKKQYIDQGLVSIEFKSFPLDLAAFNASKIAHCKNDGDSKILHYLFLNQDDWVKGETIDQLNINLKTIVNKQNFDINFNKCLSNKKIEDHILEDRINGVKKFEVNATPTIIINNKKFDKPLNFKNLKKIIEKLI
jgi:protein-disulfide isomerase|tara:strand:+ start:205 stop:786 length:582 start_codon:yes stop_codon:yes gene_type:complete